MRNSRLVLTAACVALMILVSCNIGVLPGGAVSVPLDQADAAVTISQQAGAAEATVAARITDSRGRLVELQGAQAVSVNGQNLTGPDARGEYAQTIAAAAEYAVTVNEPTMGVSQTAIARPGDFEITAPAAGATVSLSGFSINWASADPALQIRLTITQTLFGAERTRTFGPFTDTGNLTLDNEDLRDFQQGANLVITLSRIRQRASINGFNNATLSAELWKAVTVTPGA